MAYAFWPWTGIVAVIFLVFLLVIFRGWIMEALGRLRRRLYVQSLQKRIQRLEGLPLSEVMAKDVVTITKRASARECMLLFAGHNIGSVVVMDDGKVAGIITERDILKGIREKGAARFACQDIMSSPVKSMSRGQTFGDAVSYSLRNGVRKIPILQEGVLRGIVTATDMQFLVGQFFKANDFDEVPLVGSLMTDQMVLVESDALVEAALDRFLKRNADAIVVLRKGALTGILTERDILNEFIENPSFISKTRVAAVMKTRVLTVAAETRIDEANRIMLENNVRRLPVVSGQEVIGIVTQIAVVESAHHFFSLLSGDGWMVGAGA